MGARERRRRVRSSFSSLSLSSSQKQKHHTTMMVAVSSFLARAFGLDGLRRQNTSLSPERERGGLRHGRGAACKQRLLLPACC